MAITRWDTYRDVLALQNRMNSLFQDFSRSGNGESELATAGFVPPVDIFEDENKLVLKIEIPGIRQEDIDVRLENNTLTVKGERSFQSEGKEENFHRVERRYGSFYRAFTLPTPIGCGTCHFRHVRPRISFRFRRKRRCFPCAGID